MRKSLRIAEVALLLGFVALAGTAARAEDKVLVKVDGIEVKESDLKLVEAELGPGDGRMAEADRRRLMVEYLIDSRLLAAAAERASLGSGPDFEARLAYYKRRALRDTFFHKNVTQGVAEADARKFYDEQVAKIPVQEEVHARHILVEKKEEAKDIVEQLRGGDDFATLAKEKSKDPGSGANGGDLGYFGRGKMVKPFEDAVFALKPGDLSEPVESQFGWHIIKLEDKRSKPLPTFESVRDRLLTALLQKKAQDVILGLRTAAKIEIVDEAFTGVASAPPPTAAGQP